MEVPSIREKKRDKKKKDKKQVRGSEARRKKRTASHQAIEGDFDTSNTKTVQNSDQDLHRDKLAKSPKKKRAHLFFEEEADEASDEEADERSKQRLAQQREEQYYKAEQLARKHTGKNLVADIEERAQQEEARRLEKERRRNRERAEEFEDPGSRRRGHKQRFIEKQEEADSDGDTFIRKRRQKQFSAAPEEYDADGNAIKGDGLYADFQVTSKGRQEAENRMKAMQARSHYSEVHLKKKKRDDGFIEHGSSEDEEDDELDEEELDQVDNMSGKYLPGLFSPPLFQVKVKRGKEQISCFQLMAKAIHLASQEGDSVKKRILSAVHSENVEGFIFVEAHEKSHVFEAIAGISTIITKVTQCTPNESTMIFEVQNQEQTHKKLKELNSSRQNCFVRVKQGVYSGDYGLVDHVEGDRLQIKLIPRFDYTSSSENNPRKSKGNFAMKKHPQKAFKPGLLPQARKVFVKRKIFYQYKTSLFRRGFIYKTYNVRALEIDQVEPSQVERQKFIALYESSLSKKVGPQKSENPNAYLQEGDASDVEAEDTLRFLKNEATIKFLPKDKIIIHGGELKGVIGIVQQQHDEDIDFFPKNIEGFKDVLTVASKMVVKYFEIGDRVSVTQGTFISEIGRVISIYHDKKGEIFSSEKIKLDKQYTEEAFHFHPVVHLLKNDYEVKVNRNNSFLISENAKEESIRKSPHRKNEGGRIETRVNNQNLIQDSPFNIFDLVEIEKNLACIADIKLNNLKIVTEDNQAITLMKSSVLKHIPMDPQSRCRDSIGNLIRLGDQVFCNDNSQFSGFKGIVKNITKGRAFIFNSANYQLHNGLICEKHKYLSVVSLFESKRTFGPQSHSLRNLKDPLIQKRVIVTQGEYKSLFGTVLETVEDSCQVMLHQNNLQITIPRSGIKIMEYKYDPNRRHPPNKNEKVDPLSNSRFKVDSGFAEKDEHGNIIGGATQYPNQNTNYPPRTNYGGNQTQYGGKTAYPGQGTAYPQNYYQNGGKSYYAADSKTPKRAAGGMTAYSTSLGFGNADAMGETPAKSEVKKEH